MNQRIELRLAELEDDSDLLKIYEPYVRYSTISFEFDVPSLKEFRQRIDNIHTKYPYIICSVDNRIVGYAYANRFHARSGYDWDAELSIYIKEDYHGNKVGKRLYGALLELLHMQGIYTVYAIIATPYEKSEYFHKSFGFEKCMCLKQAGFKFSEWIDITYYEKVLCPRIGIPKDILLISEISADAVAAVLNKYSGDHYKWE